MHFTVYCHVRVVCDTFCNVCELLHDACAGIMRTCTPARLVHVAAPGVGEAAGRPVYSAIYAEWVVNVPILLVLSGRFALSRPWAEAADVPSRHASTPRAFEIN